MRRASDEVVTTLVRPVDAASARGLEKALGVGRGRGLSAMQVLYLPVSRNITVHRVLRPG